MRESSRIELLQGDLDAPFGQKADCLPLNPDGLLRFSSKRYFCIAAEWSGLTRPPSKRTYADLVERRVGPQSVRRGRKRFTEEMEMIRSGITGTQIAGCPEAKTPPRFIHGPWTFLRAPRLLTLSLLATLGLAANAQAQAPVNLGTADSFAVLAASTVTNTGPSVISGDLGVSPGNAVTGFPPGTVNNGTIHAGDAVAAQAQSDLTAAYNSAAGRACNVNLTGQDLGGLTLTSGVYCFSTSAQLTGDLTLNAQGDPDAVFIFQIGSTLTTASGSRVNLINGARACNVFWQIGSSATLGTTTRFTGNILALQSITANTGATVDGRLLARNGAVTLDTNTITRARCAGGGGEGGGGGGGGGGGAGDDDTGPIIDIDGAPGDGVPGNPLGGGGDGGGGSGDDDGGDDDGGDDDGGDDSSTSDDGERRCVGTDFRLRITARDRAGIRRISVFVDGQLIKRTKRERFFVWIRAERLSTGRHSVRVVARDRAGNRSVKKRSFRRCDQPVIPDFTG